MKIRRILLMAVLVFILILSWADTCDFVTACPYDGEMAQMDPGVRYVSGKEFHQYSHLHLEKGGGAVKHEFWVQCERND